MESVDAYWYEREVHGDSLRTMVRSKTSKYSICYYDRTVGLNNASSSVSSIAQNAWLEST